MRQIESLPNNFYSAISCEYKFLILWAIINDTGITHLSFSNELHLKALEKIKEFIPKATFTSLGPDTNYVKNLLRNVLDPRHEQPPPDFKHNPFLKNGTPFQQKAWRTISRIKPGETITYGKLAAVAGSPGGARAAGRACNQNPLPLIIPCHRVVAANGPGGFAGDMAIKLHLLEIEKELRDTQIGVAGDSKGGSTGNTNHLP